MENPLNGTCLVKKKKNTPAKKSRAEFFRFIFLTGVFMN